MEIDRNGLEVLDEDQCLQLLAGTKVGRVALCLGALPVILPVQYALDGRDPVFRTNRGAKLDSALHREVVCLEADSSDSTYHAGWSVLAIGRAEVVSDPAALERLHRLPLRPWVAGGADYFVRIKTELLSGRRIGIEARRVAEATVTA